MTRRAFIATLASAAAWPLVAGAQQPRFPVIGFLHAASPATYENLVAAFRDGLSEKGYQEKRNVTIEFRWADEKYDRLPTLMADLVNQQAAVIVAGALPAALVAKATTTTIPLVFLIGGDPVSEGLVGSLNRPSGNVTGVTLFSDTLLGKRIELLHQLVPTARTIAVLVNPRNPNAESRSSKVVDAAKGIGLQIQMLGASKDSDLTDTLLAPVRRPTTAMIVVDDPFFATRRAQLVAMAARHGMPTIYFQREFVLTGGLVSYSTRYSDLYHQAGIYTGRILNGEKPVDLPVLQPTKFELVINLKTAKALGLAIPDSFLARVDEVIE